MSAQACEVIMGWHEPVKFCGTPATQRYPASGGGYMYLCDEHSIKHLNYTESIPMEPILQFFAFVHLPPHLAAVSQPFSELANRIVETLPRNPERTVALRKLLEAKDAAVRAKIAKEV